MTAASGDRRATAATAAIGPSQTALPPMAPSASAIGVLSALLEARTGQRVGNDRVWRLDTTLTPLLRQYSLRTLDELVSLLLRGGEPAIGDQIVDALVNNETSFFRDPAVFDIIVDTVAAAAEAAGGRRLRLISAGCSTGQEPLSLAMAIAERFEGSSLPMPEIVGADVSDAAVSRARAGRYTQFEIQRGLPMRRMLRWFEGQADGDWTASPALLRMVAYRRLNLAASSWSIGTFDMILCRNVLLYLTPAIKMAVYEGFASALRPGGMLLLGAGETVLGQTRLFEPSRTVRGAYQRVATAKAAA